VTLWQLRHSFKTQMLLTQIETGSMQGRCRLVDSANADGLSRLPKQGMTNCRSMSNNLFTK
jgi:hypothetical protein